MQMNFGIADNVRNLMDALMLCSAGRKLYIQKPDKSRYRRLWGYTEKCPGYFGRGKEVGLRASGGINSPYIWVSVPDGMGSWDFFTSFFGKRRLYVRRDQDSVHAGRVCPSDRIQYIGKDGNGCETFENCC